MPIAAKRGWGDWGGPYNRGGIWLWSEHLSYSTPRCLPFPELYPCPITLIWRHSSRADGFRVYVAPSTISRWHCIGRDSPLCEPVDLKCSAAERQLLAEVDGATGTAEVLVSSEWVENYWCVMLVAFNSAGESEPLTDYLFINSGE